MWDDVSPVVLFQERRDIRLSIFTAYSVQRRVAAVENPGPHRPYVSLIVAGIQVLRRRSKGCRSIFKVEGEWHCIASRPVCVRQY